MSSSSEPETDVKITSKGPKLTPPGYDLELSEVHSQLIAEFVGSPAYKIIKKTVVRQRQDIIARKALNDSMTLEQLHLYKGMAAELQLFMKALRDIKIAVDKQRQSDGADFKK